MPKKYIVRLSSLEREECHRVIKRLDGKSHKVRRAYILLQCDANGPGWADKQISEAYHCWTRTVENIRQRLVEHGFDNCLNGMRPSTPPRKALLDGEQEARIIATRLGQPPPGYNGWSLRLLAHRVVVLRIVDSISHETCRSLSNQQKIEYWVIPPDPDAEFVANMEEVLGVYQEAYNEQHPVVCMGEQPVQLTKEVKTPVETTKDHPKRVDYEYERAGTACIFMFNEPLVG